MATQPKVVPMIKSTRSQITNAAFDGASELGLGARGAWNQISQNSSNPYNQNDFVSKWRSYVQAYETSWEARKVVRLPIEDALRKPWNLEGIPEEMNEVIKAEFERLRFFNIEKRSKMLERLLGGCLTFLGIEDDEDDPSKPYNPKKGAALRFCNAIPVSRISRISWDTNPLSEHYMRPEKFLINGQEVHATRCLVHDGDPLFDPYDFALTQFRANMSGFGQSVLAPLWDDIVKAVGTRQAAYQLIQVNNSIIAAVQDLQDITGTNPGAAKLKKIQDVVNQLSVYRAAIIDGEKVNISQSAASFGSVPELLLMFIQVLSAASDIPATRFLGQAPGGLNATGESDLENYYNMIDAYQLQRIEPDVRKMADIIGYNKFPQQWAEARKKLVVKFPPLWNLDELKAAQAAQQQIANVMSVYEAGGCDLVKVIEEINAKGALSVKLEETDIDLLKAAQNDEHGFGGEEPTDAAGEIEKLKNMVCGHRVENAHIQNFITESNGKFIVHAKSGKELGTYATKAEAEKRLREIEYFKHQNSNVVLEAEGSSLAKEIALGMKDEQEHLHEVEGSEEKVLEIVLDHLKDDPQYYSKLQRAGLMNSKLTPTQQSLLDKIKTHFTRTSEPYYPTNSERASFLALRNAGYLEWAAEDQIHEQRIRTNVAGRPGAYTRRSNGVEIWATGLKVRNSFSYEGQGEKFKWKDYKMAVIRACVWYRRYPGQDVRRICEEVLDDGYPSLYTGDPVEMSKAMFTRYVNDVTKELKSMGDFKNTLYPPRTHRQFQGLDIMIETPEGELRKGRDPQSKEVWEVKMPCDYGEVCCAGGVDGDPVDVFVGPNIASDNVYVISQLNLADKSFDEHKCVIGCDSEEEAALLYCKGFSDGNGPQRIGGIKPLTIEEFKIWLAGRTELSGRTEVI